MYLIRNFNLSRRQVCRWVTGSRHRNPGDRGRPTAHGCCGPRLPPTPQSSWRAECRTRGLIVWHQTCARRMSSSPQWSSAKTRPSSPATSEIAQQTPRASKFPLVWSKRKKDECCGQREDHREKSRAVYHAADQPGARGSGPNGRTGVGETSVG
jgi:hypothetical protein